MTELRILAVETSTEACSVALLVGDEVRERFEVAPRQHARLLLPFAASLLAEAQLQPAGLDAIAFGRGPGSFTGLRIAAGMAQGIAFGADLPVVALSTLAVLAQGTMREQGAVRVLAALDARMQEVYWGAWQRQADNTLELVGRERVCAPADVEALPDAGWYGAGSGWQTYGSVLQQITGLSDARIFPQQLPHAADLAQLAVAVVEAGAALPPEQAAPVYLRDNVAARPGADKKK